VIHNGELKGVGAVADLTSGVRGKIEIVWVGKLIPAALKGLGAECHATGDTVRAIVSEECQDAALDALRNAHLRLISLTPVRNSLEAYYVSKLQPAKAVAEVRL